MPSPEDAQKLFRSRVDSGVEFLEEDAAVAHALSEATVLAEYAMSNILRRRTPSADFDRRLKSDRLIKVFIGDATHPYLIPQSTLEAASAYFTEAIRHEYLGLGSFHENGVLRVPEGDHEVWKMLLFWLVKGEMPTDIREDLVGYDIHAMQTLMVKCWVAGGVYMIPDFQDSAILHLIYWLDVPKVPVQREAHPDSGIFPWAAMRLAFQSSVQGSAIRRVFATAALDANYRQVSDPGGLPGSHGMSELQSSLEGIPGAMHDMIDASAEYTRERRVLKTPYRYRIMEAPPGWYLFDNATIGRNSKRSRSDRLLVSLRDSLNRRIHAVVADTKISEVVPALLSTTVETSPRGGGGQTRCEQM